MIQERILKYLDLKGISRYRFYKETGFSNGFLDKKGSIGSDKCEIICSHYMDMNPTWLITGNGEMLLNEGANTIKKQVFENLNEKIEKLSNASPFAVLMSELVDKRYIVELQKKQIETLEMKLNDCMGNFREVVSDLPVPTQLKHKIHK